jgi:ketosteroid isomerase-like protein
MRHGTVLLLLLSIAAASLGQSKRDNSPLASLVEAERTFARASLEIGNRAAFLKFFADDAVVFRPGPVRYKDAMKDIPLPANPKETTLEWEPLYADIAESGDLGYTTGPAVWMDHSAAKRPPYYGYYFSIWKKQQTGEWKVAFDIGAEQPGPYTGPRKLQSPAVIHRKPLASTPDPAEYVVSLMNVEREYLEAVQQNGAIKAFGRFAGSDVRIYREKELPIVSFDSVVAYFTSRPYMTQWNPMFCDAALAGDLGYVYGGYQVNVPKEATQPAETGFYLRVWKRDAANAWRFVAEVTSPLPPPEPPK